MRSETSRFLTIFLIKEIIHLRERWKFKEKSKAMKKKGNGVACGKRVLWMETATSICHLHCSLKHETSPLTDKSSPERQRLFFLLSF
ncbi:uncharacterized protein LOC111830926 [Capsella rubella]|uniref:uncharacterized protein LOC111830926 n=1 Tax=Capsella rubella TaxID=81985 RepID=UPI000CD5A47F|nr:uncharacterized protein LOC111830926 [Capsella rubella]